jgi:hypothetical protein
MCSQEDSTEKIINEIKTLGIPILWQNAGDPYKRIWNLNADELGVALKYQNENKVYIPNKNTDKICCVCLKGYPEKDPFLKSGRKCKGCNKITYCSRECQKSDWTRHKVNCFI